MTRVCRRAETPGFSPGRASLHPHEIWKHPFEQISRASRNLLITLTTLPTEVYLEDLENAFSKFHFNQSKKHSFSTSDEDFNKSLKELEGNFIKTSKYDSGIVVKFFNPSINDFLDNFIISHKATYLSLLESSLFFEQIEKLISLSFTKNPSLFIYIQTTFNAFIGAINETIFSKGCRLINVRYYNNKMDLRRYSEPLEGRLLFLLRMLHEKINRENTELYLSNFQEWTWKLVDGISIEKYSRPILIGLLNYINKIKFDSKLKDILFYESKKYLKRLVKESPEIEYFELFSEFEKNFPEYLSQEERKELIGNFESYYELNIENWLQGDSSDQMMDTASNLEKITENLKVTPDYRISALEEAAEKIMNETSEVEEENVSISKEAVSKIEDDEKIKNLFDTLNLPSSK